ncbi:MAG: hydrogenase iron-sulfur subunit [Candidatus Bathyarchaeia archaeon]
MLAESCIKIRDEYCSKCVICSSTCPFEAISLDKETDKMILDIEKCQVCGICFSACPSSSIELAYYKAALFIDFIKNMRKDNLVLMCKGTVIRPEVRENLKKHGIEDGFIPLYVPCVGRIPPELLLELLALGVRRVAVLSCDEDKCRFKVGSDIGILRFSLLQRLLNQLGFGDDVLTFIRSSIKARINTYRCIGCGNCAYICQYNAIKIAPPGIARIDENTCVGCGACAAVCPALAINLEGFEHDLILETISKLRSLVNEVKTKIGKPVVLVFYCQWANFPPPDKHQSYSEENVVFLEIPCSSMLNPLYVLQAFYSGFDGVLVAACKKGECKFERGNELAERYVIALKRLLKQVNLENKFEICFVSPKYLGEFNAQIKSFIDKIAYMALEGFK